jgi:hypothetical protein
VLGLVLVFWLWWLVFLLLGLFVGLGWVGTTLLPGDLIPTGTPFGVGFSRNPPVFMKDGDECVCEVEQIGSIRNRVRLASR